MNESEEKKRNPKDLREEDEDEEEEDDDEGTDEEEDSDDEDSDDDSDEDSDSDGERGVEDVPGEDDGRVNDDVEISDDQVVQGYGEEVPQRILKPRSEPLPDLGALSAQPPSAKEPESSSSIPSDWSSKAPRLESRDLKLTGAIRRLMYGCGDVPVPLLESMHLLGDIALDFIREMTMKTIQVSGNKDRINGDDLLFALRDESRLRARALELLDMNKLLKEVKGKDDKGKKLVSAGDKRSHSDQKKRKKRKRKRKQ